MPSRRDRARPHPESLAVGALLTALVALGQISTAIYMPSLPSLVATLNTDAAAAGRTLSFFLFGFGVCQLVYGPLSDRFGRRPVLLVGVALYLVASIACAFAPTIEALIAGRFLQGMSASAGPVLGRAIVRDVYGPVRAAKALAYIGVALAISPAVAPVIGGYLQAWFGWRAAFWFLSAVGVVLFTAIALFLQETHHDRDPRALNVRRLAGAYRALLISRAYWGHALAVAFVFAGLMAFTAGAPFVFISVLGLSPEHFGMLSVFNVCGFLAGSLAAGRWTLRIGSDRLLLVGVSLCLLGGAAMAAIAIAGAIGIAAIIAPMTVFTAGMGIVLANGIAGAMAPFPRTAGTASALLGFVQMVVAGLASQAVGAFQQTSQLPMAGIIAGCALVAFVVFIALAWRRRADRAAPAAVPPRFARSGAAAPFGERDE